MVEPVGAPILTPPWRWRLARALLGVRLPERYRPWVAASLRVYDDLRYRALKCAVLFLLIYAGAAVLVGPRLFPGALFNLAGTAVGLLLGIWFVGRSQRRRDLPYRLAGVHRDGSTDSSAAPNWLALVNAVSVVALVVAVVVWTATPLGATARMSLARIEGRCQAAPAVLRQHLEAEALPGTTFTGIRQVQYAGRLFVVANVSRPNPPPGTLAGQDAGPGAWWVLPHFFATESGLLEPVNQAAAAATPAAGAAVQHGIAYGNALRCATPATAGQTVSSPPVTPSVPPGKLRIDGPVEVAQDLPAERCGPIASIIFQTAGHTVSVTVIPPNATIYIDNAPFWARGTVDADGIKVSGPLRASTPPSPTAGYLAAPVGSAEIWAPCHQ